MRKKPVGVLELVLNGSNDVGTLGTDRCHGGNDGNPPGEVGNIESIDFKSFALSVPTVPDVPTVSNKDGRVILGLCQESHMEGRPELSLERLEDRIQEFAEGLAADFSHVPRLRQRVYGTLKRVLPRPAGGRPGLNEVTEALELRRHGYSWAAVYSKVIANYPELPPDIRQSQQRQLRDRVRNRQHWNRKRMQKALAASVE